MSITPQITTHYRQFPSPLPGSPSFHFHLTRLTNTLMLWVGAAPPSIEEPISAPEDIGLASEWAAAWTAGSSTGTLRVGTPIYRASASDIAVPMAQRLAKRHPKHQIFLSLSIPSSLTASGLGSASDHPYAGRILLMVEKALSQWLVEVLTESESKSDAS